jgi:hypothetical protein
MGIAAGAMKQEHGIVGISGSVLMRCAKRQVVELKLGQRLTGAEAKVRQRDGVVDGRPTLGREETDSKR